MLYLVSVKIFFYCLKIGTVKFFFRSRNYKKKHPQQMNERLNVYDINNYAYLEKDIEITIDKIGNLYEIHFLKNKIVFVSKIILFTQFIK